MNHRVLSFRAMVLAFVMTLLIGLCCTGPAHAAGADGTSSARVVAVCPTKPPPGHFSCLALRRTDVRPKSRTEQAFTPFIAPMGYAPADLVSAYAIPTDQGAGATVAIIDAYDDPNAEADLATYRAQYGLPPCTTANGCFRKVGETGSTTVLPSADTAWASEIALDIEMVSASCPLCNILLVEANSDSIPDLSGAENWATYQPGVRAVSNSYGAPESSTDLGTSAYYRHRSVAVIASAGDDGYGPVFPAASPYVIAVGGTALSKTTGTTRGWTESVWSNAPDLGTGSGCSVVEPKPVWQHDTSCSARTVADISAVADPDTGVAVYDSYGGNNGWGVIGGTSVSAPLVAGMYAIANAANPSAAYAYLPANAAGLNDVTSGANQSGCSTYLCSAVTGYDGPTGNGSPNGLIALGGPGSTAPPSLFSVTLAAKAAALAPGASTTVPVATTTTSGAQQTLALSVTGAPAGVTATINPSSVTSDSPATMAISTTSKAPSGSYQLTVTATGTDGSTQSAPYTLLLAPCSGSQLLPNPGFESGVKAWLPGGKAVIGKGTGANAPHKGKQDAVLGTIHHNDNLRQINVTWSTTCRTATLSFWLKVNTTETTKTAAHDTFKISFGSTVLGTWSNLTKTHGWKQLTVHTTFAAAHASPGRTTLRFDASENSTRRTTFVVDDVSFTASG